jgi:hypothetical protein
MTKHARIILLGLSCLAITGMGTAVADKAEKKNAKDTPKVASIWIALPQELSFGAGKATYKGALIAMDAVAKNQKYHKVFAVKMEAGKVYKIEMHNDATPGFDAFLILENDKGEMLAADDDSAGNLDSRIIFRPTATGIYRIITTTFPPRQMGKFILAITIEQ